MNTIVIRAILAASIATFAMCVMFILISFILPQPAKYALYMAGTIVGMESVFAMIVMAIILFIIAPIVSPKEETK